MTNSVSNDGRPGLCIAGSALLGCGAGVGTAILTKPYSNKDGSILYRI